MVKRQFVLRAVMALVLVWVAVIAIRSFAGSKRVTAENIERKIEAADFEDWSDGMPIDGSSEVRSEKLEEIAEMFNRLDFGERQRAREERVGEEMFNRLTRDEKERFVDLTIRQSMETFMEAVDAMAPAERKKVIEDGLRQIEDGRTEEEIAKAREVSDRLLSKITEEGLRAYFEKAGADAKQDLAPLMEAMDGVMKGLSGNEFPMRE